MNVGRNGHVFVVAHPRDVEALEVIVRRLADAGRAAHEAVLVLAE